MQVLFGIFIALSSIFLVLLMRSLTTLFHELGHALPALLFTEEGVEVFIGTYGAKDNCWHIDLGRLQLYLRLNLMDWKIGMCVHNGEVQTWQNLIIVLAGPFASMLIAVPLLLLVILVDLPALSIGIMMIFFASAVIDLVVNLIPFGTGLQDDKGYTIYNDGLLFLTLLSRIGLSQDYLDLEEAYRKKDYDQVLQQIDSQLEQPKVKHAAYFLKINALTQTQQYQQALDTYLDYGRLYKLSAADWYPIAQLYLKLQQKEEAFRYLNQHLYKHYGDANALADRAALLIEIGNEEQAWKDCNAAIHYGGGHFKAYLIRSKLSIKYREYATAEADLKAAQRIDNNNPLLYYHWGKYYKARGIAVQAIANFEKAQSLGLEMPGLDFEIETLR